MALVLLCIAAMILFLVYFCNNLCSFRWFHSAATLNLPDFNLFSIATISVALVNCVLMHSFSLEFIFYHVQSSHVSFISYCCKINYPDFNLFSIVTVIVALLYYVVLQSF